MHFQNVLNKPKETTIRYHRFVLHSIVIRLKVRSEFFRFVQCKMKIPINKLTKLLKPMTQWSTPMTITFCLYLLFVMVVLSISFPLKSQKSKLLSIDNNRENSIGFRMNGDDDDDDDGDDDANELGENEHKILQRAHDLPTANNRTDILRDAFQR